MIVLDTHTWLYLRSDPDKLPAPARDIVGRERAVLATISCWEVATLARLGRITLDRAVGDWVSQALAAEPSIEAVPLDPSIAVVAGALGDGFPGDPADRIIYATARSLGWPLVTKDRRIRSYAPAHTIWD